MTKKPTTRLRDAVQALAAIPDPEQRALEAGEMADAARDATSDIARIRAQAIREMRAQQLSYRQIGERLGIHFTRVKQLETGTVTGRRKPATTTPATAEPPDA